MAGAHRRATVRTRRAQITTSTGAVHGSRKAQGKKLDIQLNWTDLALTDTTLAPTGMFSLM